VNRLVAHALDVRLFHQWQDDMTQQCLDNDIRISPVQGRAHVLFDGAEIASSIKALELHEPGQPLRIYFPRDDIQPGILEASDTRTTCPYKGEANYYTIKTLTADGPDQAWYYPDPCPLVEQIRDLVAFQGDRVEYRLSQV
jgi:uncharacterized protein (DUF427 family)